MICIMPCNYLTRLLRHFIPRKGYCLPVLPILRNQKILDCLVISYLSNNVIASVAKQSRLLNNLKNWIVPSFKTGLLRHFVPRKDVSNYGTIWNDLYRAII